MKVSNWGALAGVVVLAGATGAGERGTRPGPRHHPARVRGRPRIAHRRVGLGRGRGRQQGREGRRGDRHRGAGRSRRQGGHEGRRRRHGVRRRAGPQRPAVSEARAGDHSRPKRAGGAVPRRAARHGERDPRARLVRGRLRHALSRRPAGAARDPDAAIRRRRPPRRRAPRGRRRSPRRCPFDLFTRTRNTRPSRDHHRGSRHAARRVLRREGRRAGEIRDRRLRRGESRAQGGRRHHVDQRPARLRHVGHHARARSGREQRRVHASR